MPRPWSALLLSLAIVLAWWPALSAPYQYDDYVTPLKDPASQSLAAWADTLPVTLRPLTKLSFALESSLGAVDAPARRLVQLAMFIGCALILAELAYAALAQRWLALGLALLWAMHPVHAETWVALAGRSVLLSLLLTLASAWCLVHRRTSGALVFAVLAVLSRETAVAWLVGCALLVAHERGLSRTKVLASTSIAALSGALLVLASSRMRYLLAFSWSDASAWNRLGLQWAALTKGTLMLFIDPAGFSVDIDYAPQGLLRLAALLASFALYGGALWLALHGPRLPRIAACLWLSWVLPLHSVVPKLDPLTARSFSASSAALVFALASGLTKARMRTTLAALGLAASLLGIVTHQRARLYRDPIALWRDAAERSRESIRPLVNLGTLLAQAGRLDEARSALEQARGRNPNGTDVRERLSAVDVLIETRRLLTEPNVVPSPREVDSQ